MPLDERRKQYLAAMGIPVWEAREGWFADFVPSEIDASPSPQAVAIEQPVVTSDRPVIDWDALQQQVAACTACELHQSRTNTVFGVGNTQAQLMVIGEAPGADEDKQGEPFVGRAGKLLNEMLLAIGFKREEVFIANILKCRPPNNRDPKPEEVALCESFLEHQIQYIRPKIILSVGRISAQNLLKTDTPVGKLRGHAHRYGVNQTPLVVTYHPAYLLRSPLDKRKAWGDLLLALNMLRSTVQ